MTQTDLLCSAIIRGRADPVDHPRRGRPVTPSVGANRYSMHSRSIAKDPLGRAAWQDSLQQNSSVMCEKRSHVCPTSMSHAVLRLRTLAFVRWTSSGSPRPDPGNLPAYPRTQGQGGHDERAHQSIDIPSDAEPLKKPQPTGQSAADGAHASSGPRSSPEQPPEALRADLR